MITTRDLQEAIAECQGNRNPNANTCIKLAAYYTIMDHIEDERDFGGYSFAVAPSIHTRPSYSSDTEFGSTVEDMDVNVVYGVMDELMSTLNVINPRLYAGVMRKLREE